MASLPFETIYVLLEVFVFLALAEILGALGSRRGIPTIVTCLLLGLLLSGFALGGVINRGIHLDLFDASSPSSSYLGLFSDLSVVLLLFAAGLEGGFQSLREAGPAVVAGAIAGDLVPFALTVVVSLLFLPWTVALLLGVAVAPTSSAVVASLRRAEKVEKTPGGKFLINLAALDDVVALVLLSAVLTVVGGQLDALAITGGIAESVLAWVILLVAAVVIVPRVLKVPAFREATGLPFLFLFVLVVVVVVLGLSAVVGAFIAGLAVAESLVAERTRAITEVLLLFFGSLFFVIVGAQFDSRLFGDLPVVAAGLGIAGLAIAGKVVGVYPFARRRLGEPSAARAVAIGMMPRGEIGLVVGALGLAAGFLDRKVLGIILIVSLVTTIAGSFGFRRVAKALGPTAPGGVAGATPAGAGPAGPQA